MLAAILVLAGLGAFFAVGYVLNSRTPAPEGCENLKAECEGCRITSCAHHPVKQTEGEKEE